jgi:para-nitrobenzyl esterase
MVWLHGGAFAYGSAHRAVTDGSNLARRGDVVVVSVNHRLNIFGFLHLQDIGGPAWTHSGNAGVLDLVAGIRQSIEPYAREIREIEEKPAETPDRATERSPRPASKRVPPIT